MYDLLSSLAVGQSQEAPVKIVKLHFSIMISDLRQPARTNSRKPAAALGWSFLSRSILSTVSAHRATSLSERNRSILRLLNRDTLFAGFSAIIFRPTANCNMAPRTASERAAVPDPPTTIARPLFCFDVGLALTGGNVGLEFRDIDVR